MEAIVSKVMVKPARAYAINAEPLRLVPAKSKAPKCPWVLLLLINFASHRLQNPEHALGLWHGVNSRILLA